MATNKPFKMVKGKRVDLTAKEIKSYVMSVNNWTEKEYNAERYKLKNRLRTYEAYRGTPADQVQSPVNILYYQAKRLKQFQIEQAKEPSKVYTPSFQMQRLQSMPAYGNVKALNKAISSGRLSSRVDDPYRQAVLNRFKDFIANNDKAREISENITNPVQLENALSDYADKVHAKIDEQRKENENSAIPIPAGETYGSDLELDDFDYSDYLD